MKLRRESVISGLDVVMMTLELHGRMVGSGKARKISVVKQAMYGQT
jgi:hypothetical protein